MKPALGVAGIAGLGALGAGAVYGYGRLSGLDNPPVPRGPKPTVGPLGTADMGMHGRGALPEHRWTRGNDVELLVDYREAMPRLMQDIAAAKEVINVVEYIWKPNGPGLELADLLVAKAQPDANGHRVEVNVVVDEHGTLDRSVKEREQAEAMLDRFRAAGINVRVNPKAKSTDANPLHIDHRKMFDIDNRVSHVGGMGLGQSYAGWHDAMLRIEGPASAQVGAEFVARWTDMGGEISERQAAQLRKETLHPTPAPNGDGKARLVANTPGVHQAATDDLMTAARTAKKRLWVQAPNIGDDKAAEALAAAARRGVDVNVIMAGPDAAWMPHRKLVSRTYYRDMVKAGVKVHHYPRMVHTKAWLADDKLTLGSTNLSHRALYYATELSATVRDKDVTQKFEEMYRHDVSISDEVTADDTDGLGLRFQTKVRQLLDPQ